MHRYQRLEKICKVYSVKAESLKRKCVLSKNILNAEIKKCDFLADCLKDYRSRLSGDTDKTFYSHQYQRYQLFFVELQNAIEQQTAVVLKFQNQYTALFSEYELLNNKIKKIHEMIDKEIDALEYKKSCKENQQLIDLYNQLTDSPHIQK